MLDEQARTNLVVSPEALANPSSDDLYAVLGLTKLATAVEIRRAYRKVAMKYHPDRNGNSEAARKAFQKIQHAYEILSNLKQREFYDNTNALRPTDEKIEENARNLMHDTFTTVFDEIASQGDDFKVEIQDPVKVVHTKLMQTAANIEAQRQGLQRALRRYEYLLRKFKHQDRAIQHTAVGNMLVEKIEAHKRAYSLSELDVIVHQKAAEAALVYNCPPEPQPMTFTFQFNGVQSTGGMMGY